jgi:hypothetical protein
MPHPLKRKPGTLRLRKKLWKFSKSFENWVTQSKGIQVILPRLTTLDLLPATEVKIKSPVRPAKDSKVVPAN